ncbi:MAG: SDR family oxidoreductase [Pirellulaceae bacterium]
MKPTAIISGASSGIGLACAKRLARAGYRIAMIGRDEGRMAEAFEQVCEAGNDNTACLPIVADLGGLPPFDHLVEQTTATLGPVDVLVNAAGYASAIPFEDLSPDEFATTSNVNMRGLFFLTQACYRVMKERGRGIVVNISSLAALSPFPGFSAYGASKAWVDLFTIAIANEGREHGIRAFSVRPGTVETPMLRGLFPDFPAEQTVAPEDIAEVVWQLTTESFRFSSGQAINVTKQS